MKNKFKVILLVFLTVCVLTFTFTGCARPDTDEQNQTETLPERDMPAVPGDDIGRTPTPRTGNRNGNILNNDLDDDLNINETPGVNNGRNTNGLDRETPVQQTNFDKERADKITTQLEKVEGVDEVSVVVNGNTAVVVYTPTDPDKASNETDNMVVEKVKDIDNGITKVEVSRSAAAMTKIRKLIDDIGKNKPMEELNDMFEDLMRIINPQS